jgi:heme exporter protein B
LPRSNAGLMGRAYAVLAKDMRQELRTRYALSTILMFAITSLAMVSFSLGQGGLPPHLLSALFWIIMFFSSMAGLSQVFVREEETGTALALKLAADPTAIYLGKLIFNLMLLSTMALIITPGFFIFMDAPTHGLLAFATTVLLGVLALCGATTLIAAIIAKAAMKGALFAVIALPIILVPMMVLVGASAKALDVGTLASISIEMQAIFAYVVVMTTLSFILFRYVWLE